MIRFLKQFLLQSKNDTSVQQFQADGYLPWTKGYVDHKWQQINEAINSDEILQIFRNQSQLPPKFGWRLDERIIEYSWLLSQLELRPRRLFDAGSALNFELILKRLHELGRNVTIMTLEPEQQAYWKLKVSYQYGDLRQTPFQDEWFDEIVSVSTLEHIGFDNTFYGSNAKPESGNYIQAVNELWRILKPNGVLYITLPYGEADDIIINGKVFARQFNADMLDRLLGCLKTDSKHSVFYRYTADGWILSEQSSCDDLHYFNIHTQQNYDEDVAAAARAVCCIRAIKPELL